MKVSLFSKPNLEYPQPEPKYTLNATIDLMFFQHLAMSLKWLDFSF